MVIFISEVPISLYSYQPYTPSIYFEGVTIKMQHVRLDLHQVTIFHFIILLSNSNQIYFIRCNFAVMIIKVMLSFFFASRPSNPLDEFEAAIFEALCEHLPAHFNVRIITERNFPESIVKLSSANLLVTFQNNIQQEYDKVILGW